MAQKVSLQQLMTEHGIKADQKNVRRKLRDTFTNRTKGNRWEFEVGSKDHNTVLEMLGVEPSSVKSKAARKPVKASKKARSAPAEAAA